MDIQKYTGLNSVGVIEIFQKKAKTTELDGPKSTNEKLDGEFRVPNVFPIEPANPKRNTRTTLLWIPDQKIDQTGQFEFEVTSGKVISDFVIEVQGMASDGRMGAGEVGFTVTK